MKNIYIVLASYRGERYIAEQLESIQNQTEKNWILLVRDDGSDDRTIGIVENISKSDGRIRIIKDNLGRLGAAASFLVLCDNAFNMGADYVLFSDQDDYWLSDKVSKQVAHINKIEKDVNVPIAAYCDLEVVDQQLKKIASSYMKYKNISHPQKQALGFLLFQNTVTGCACIVNRALLAILYNTKSSEIVMHDWWVALLASSTGILSFDSTIGLKYRQHGSNQIGVNRKSLVNSIGEKLDINKRRENSAVFFKYVRQMKCLDMHLKKIGKNSESVHLLSTIIDVNFFSRLQLLMNFQVRRSTLLGTVLLWFRILNFRSMP